MKKQIRKTLRDRAGFTLVELIVVIAILGILAGIGTVSYQGYIKKAHRAADEQLLGAVNWAFGAACLEENMDAQDVSYANLPISAAGTSTPTVTAVGADGAAIGAAFDKYFAESKTTPWKYYKNLIFLSGKGTFIGLGDKNITPTEIDTAAKESLGNSNFNNKQGQMINEVSTLSNALATKNFDMLYNIMGGAESDYGKYLASLKLTTDKNSPDYDPVKLANASALFVAQQSAALDPTAAYTNLATKISAAVGENGKLDPNKGAEALVSIVMPQKGEPGDTLTNAALLYGVATGYLNSDYASENAKKYAAENKVDGYQSMLMYLGNVAMDDNFMDYFNSTETKGAQKDIEGYLGALGVVNSYGSEVNISVDNALMDPSFLETIYAVLG